MARNEKVDMVKAKEDSVILKEAFKERGALQIDVADKLGIRSATLSGNINRRRMGLDVFRDILNALDYDVCVVDRNSGEIMWKVAQDE